jgi:hypothetical protein
MQMSGTQPPSGRRDLIGFPSFSVDHPYWSLQRVDGDENLGRDLSRDVEGAVH